ncbi:unnamed protein product, partial [marine sediment metagenome]
MCPVLYESAALAGVFGRGSTIFDSVLLQLAILKSAAIAMQ